MPNSRKEEALPKALLIAAGIKMTGHLHAMW